ncbi:E3 SUMO-protein ligase KIAA1586-like [Photinus pyralis]|uniref:E3 SUMO-protein ligase KIAA1586-like n=1 Tax=Photinus pyralis TaxID=7054 RepID=UPI001267546E|nr:E3 SUMO-protein ligase KIAA1586-like [Photinus pyralis]
MEATRSENEVVNDKNDQIEDSDSHSDQDPTVITLTPYPSIWSADQYKNFSDKNPWLEVGEGKLGCKLCREVNVKGLGVLKEQGVYLSAEWCECRVGPSLNEKRSTQLSNLRVKLKKHGESKAHQMAQEIKKQSEKHVVEELLRKESEEANDATAKIFRTVYYLAKSDRPFSDHEGLVELQQLNGINLGLILHSCYSAVQIVDHIASEMINKMISHVIASNAKLSVLVDESSTLGLHLHETSFNKSWGADQSSIKTESADDSPTQNQRLRINLTAKP